MVRLTLVLPGAVDCSLAVTNNSPVWRLHGTHSGLTLVSPGAVDCSLAVTNNSPVWRLHGTHSGLTLVSPGAVDCSLAVTNNSPVWRPQGTRSEAYPCIIITVQFVWWYYSVLPFCKSFNLGEIPASKCRAVLSVSTEILITCNELANQSVLYNMMNMSVWARPYQLFISSD